MSAVQGSLFDRPRRLVNPYHAVRCSVCWRPFGGRPIEALLRGWAFVYPVAQWYCKGCRRPGR